MREAENALLFSLFPEILAAQSSAVRARLFTVEAGRDPHAPGAIAAAAILTPDGSLLVTWAPAEALTVLTDSLARIQAQVTNVAGPNHVPWLLARLWGDRTNQSPEIGTELRVFQIVRLRHQAPATGRLELATSADADWLTPWFEGFVRAIAHEPGSDIASVAAGVRNGALNHRQLYIWKTPEPVAMAAWAGSTPRGGALNCVYVPPEFRGRGHGKDVVAALVQHMFDQGRQLCTIMTDANDVVNNRFYQSLGARPVADCVRWQLKPRPPVAPFSGPCIHLPQNATVPRGGLNVIVAG